MGRREFAGRVARDVRPSLVVGDAALLITLGGEWPKLMGFRMAGDEGGALPEEEAGAVEGLSRDTPLQILFTSGTTGEPKGVVHTHGNVLASVEPIEEAARGYMRYERLIHPLRILHTLPLSHVFGQTMGMWVPPTFGAEVHFEDRLTASRLIETIREERISVLAAVPRVLAMMKSHLEVEIWGWRVGWLVRKGCGWGRNGGGAFWTSMGRSGLSSGASLRAGRAAGGD